MGVGCILANIPGHFAVIRGRREPGFLQVLYEAGIANELFPVMIFVAVGAMCDFTPLIRQPYVMLFAAAAHLGIFCSGASGISFWISFQPGGGDWHHRRGGRSDDDFLWRRNLPRNFWRPSR